MSFKLIAIGIETTNMSVWCEMEIDGGRFNGYSDWQWQNDTSPGAKDRHAMRHAFLKAKVDVPDNSVLDSMVQAWWQEAMAKHAAQRQSSAVSNP